jgi:hypothetical protein
MPGYTNKKNRRRLMNRSTSDSRSSSSPDYERLLGKEPAYPIKGPSSPGPDYESLFSQEPAYPIERLPSRSNPSPGPDIDWANDKKYESYLNKPRRNTTVRRDRVLGNPDAKLKQPTQNVHTPNSPRAKSKSPRAKSKSPRAKSKSPRVEPTIEVKRSTRSNKPKLDPKSYPDPRKRKAILPLKTIYILDNYTGNQFIINGSDVEKQKLEKTKWEWVRDEIFNEIKKGHKTKTPKPNELDQRICSGGVNAPYIFQLDENEEKKYKVDKDPDMWQKEKIIQIMAPFDKRNDNHNVLALSLDSEDKVAGFVLGCHSKYKGKDDLYIDVVCSFGGGKQLLQELIDRLDTESVRLSALLPVVGFYPKHFGFEFRKDCSDKVTKIDAEKLEGSSSFWRSDDLTLDTMPTSSKEELLKLHRNRLIKAPNTCYDEGITFEGFYNHDQCGTGNGISQALCRKKN